MVAKLDELPKMLIEINGQRNGEIDYDGNPNHPIELNKSTERYMKIRLQQNEVTLKNGKEETNIKYYDVERCTEDHYVQTEIE